MTESLKIAVADDEVEMRDYLRETLSLLGHHVICVADNGRQLVERCSCEQPELVITDIKMPELDGIDAAGQICKDNPIPVILISAYHDHELLERAVLEHVLAYLVKPIKQADLEIAIGLVMRRFKEFQALHQQADDLRQALEDRKQIERAKGVLMKRAGLDEADAFRRLQKISNDKNQKMIEIARMIITAEEAMQ